MMGNNPNPDLVNIIPYIKFGEILLIRFQVNKILTSIKGHNYVTNVRKMMCNNPILDLVNMNEYIKLG